MAHSIKDPETDRIIRERARIKRKLILASIREACENEIQRECENAQDRPAAAGRRGRRALPGADETAAKAYRLRLLHKRAGFLETAVNDALPSLGP
jgi:hypothetical protein